MEVPTSSSSVPESILPAGMEQKRKGRVTRKTLKAVLEECQKALELLKNADLDAVVDEEDVVRDKEEDVVRDKEEDVESGEVSESSSSKASLSSLANDSETDEICNLLRSRIESPEFLEKLGSIHMSIPQNISAGEGTSWDVVTASELWDDESIDRDNVTSDEGYILVDKEDIADGIACFMAAYLLSLKQTKDLSPNQLQEALSRTFSIKKKKGKLRKAWDGSKVVYNVASWGGTAIGIYQNPALLKAASAAFWTSCRVISKFF